MGGDTGAWVIQNGTGRVCGVVLAWDERSKIAYIMPMEIILEDIKRTLGAGTVCIPSRKTMAAGINKERSPVGGEFGSKVDTAKDFKSIPDSPVLGSAKRPPDEINPTDQL